MVSAKHTILLIAALVILIIPLAISSHGSTPSTAALSQGFHETLFVDHLDTVSGTGTEAINVDSPTTVFGDLRAVIGGTKFRVHSNGGVSIGSNNNPASNGLYLQGDLLTNADATINGNLQAQSASITGALQAESITASNSLSVPEICLDENCQTSWPAGGGGLGDITGTGTLNEVPYFSAQKELTSSNNLYFDGSQLGVGTSSPSATLDVAGTTKLQEVEITQQAQVRENMVFDSGKGVVLRSSDGNCHRLRVTDAGSIHTSSAECPGIVAPTGLSAQMRTFTRLGAGTNVEAELSWTLADDGGAGVEYTLQKDGAVVYSGPSTSRIHGFVDLLEQGDTITYQLRAQNSAGSVSTTVQKTVYHGVEGTLSKSLYCENEYNWQNPNECYDPKGQGNMGEGVLPITATNSQSGAESQADRFCQEFGYVRSDSHSKEFTGSSSDRLEYDIMSSDWVVKTNSDEILNYISCTNDAESEGSSGGSSGGSESTCEPDIPCATGTTWSTEECECVSLLTR